jgi:alcohol dehydrogenase (cytochrome c)
LLIAITSASASAQVPYERIVNAALEPRNWLTYSGDYAGHRYSPLTQIDAQNIGSLKMAWAMQMPSARTETSPIVVDGIVYLTGPNFAFAVDGHTGRKLWSWRRSVPANFRINGFGSVNRGAAVMGDKLYVGALDGSLVALDLKSGAERWVASVADWRKGYAITAAPLAAAGKVVVGVSGGEAGVRGFLDAYDAETGRRAWRFYTVPADGEAGVETWEGSSWKTGGGPTWVTGSFDPQTGLLYWGVGNPSPDWNGDRRSGDNLYTCSLVALDIATGELRWYFQFTPHDTHDWDSNHVPMLFDAKIAGLNRKLVAVANRNAFYYLLDRTTGAFVSATQFATQTWNNGFDAKGRPIARPGNEPTTGGNVVSPNYNGGTVWQSPSYSPRTRLVYIAARDTSARYFKRDTPFAEGAYYPGGGGDLLPFEEHKSGIRALEAETGKLKWEYTLLTPPWAGVLTTASDLVFSGSDEGLFYALDALSGKLLWSVQLGGVITANPVSYAVDGRQYVAIAADRVIYVFGLPETGTALRAEGK